jgi:ribosomal protein S18 acetylase RimI-like enzyme
MSQADKLQRLTEQQLPQAIAMIGKAFHNDPLSIYIYPNEAERARRLPLMFSVALRYTLRYGEITTTPEGTGAACWLPPECTTVTIRQLLRVGALATPFQVGLSALLRMNGAEDYTRNMHKRCLAEPHWYLWVLGVDPEHQGKGIGGALLRAGLERADASSLPCYLETMNPNNVPLYQKFGFTIAEEGDIPGSNVHTWGMVRPAR